MTDKEEARELNIENLEEAVEEIKKQYICPHLHRPKLVWGLEVDTLELKAKLSAN